MSWLKWILDYLFDCFHPRTSWPHRDHLGRVYVCCLDCGRQLPYSMEYMRIISRKDEFQGERGWGVLDARV